VQLEVGCLPVLAHEDVVWLQVSVYHPNFVDLLDQCHQLDAHLADLLLAEALLVIFLEDLQALSESVHHKTLGPVIRSHFVYDLRNILALS